MKFRAHLKNSLFLKSIRLAKSQPGKIGVMVLFDVMFVMSFFILQKLSAYFAGSVSSYGASPGIFVFLAFSFLYYLAALLLYILFKHSLLGFIKALFGTGTGLSRFWGFCLLNISLAAIFFTVALGLNFLLLGVKPDYTPIVFIFLAVPYLLILYVVLNLSHSIFYEGAAVKNTLESSFRITFFNPGKYREIILTMIVFALFSWALLSGGGYLAGLLASKGNVPYLNSYGIFRQVSIAVLDIAFYLIILVNRVSFYSIACDR